MKQPLVRWLLGIAVAMTLIGMWLYRENSNHRALDQGNDASKSVATTREGNDAPQLSPADDAHHPTRTLPKKPIVVTDENGKPLKGALFSWTPIRTDWLEQCVAEEGRPFAAIEAGSIYAVSDEDGHVEAQFDVLEPAVIWITHSNHIARWFSSVEGSAISLPPTIALVASPGIRATVEIEKEGPAAGVSVTQCVDMWDVSSQSAPPSMIAARLFQRRIITDGFGSADVSPIDGYHHLLATQGDLVSSPWIGRQPAAPMLILRKGFSASGTVPAHVAGPESKSSDRVVVTALIDNVTEDVGSSRVREDGTWGPVTLPCFVAQEYRYQLESTVWIPTILRRPAPHQGDRVRVDFLGEKGLDLPIKVTDLNGAPIEGVRIAVNANVGGVSVGTYCHSNSAGFARLTNIRPGHFTVSTLKAGYCDTQSPELEMYENATGPYPITLSVGGELRGHCKSGALPVKTFEVRYWRDDGLTYVARRFADHADGSFSIDGMPLGHCSVIAFSRDHPRGIEHSVEIVAGRITELEIDLPNAVIGKGHVVSSSTGEPITMARVQPIMQVGSRSLGEWGAAHVVNPDGSFAFAGFSPGPNMLVATSDGFASAFASASVSADGSLDFGIVTMHKAGSLQIAIKTDQAVHPERFSVGLSQRDVVPPVAMNGNGEATFDSLSPGQYSALVSLDGPYTLQAICNVMSGHVTKFELDYRRCRDLFAELSAGPEYEIPTNVQARVSYLDELGGFLSYYVAFDEKRRVDLSRIPNDRMVIDVIDGAGAILKTMWVTSQRAKPEVVQIKLGAPPMSVRVVDVQHQPLSGVIVQFQQLKDGAGWQVALPTDAQGELNMGSVQADSLTVMLRSPIGCKWFESVSVPTKPDEVIELVLDVPAALTVMVLDGSVPLPAVNLDVMDPLGGEFIFQQPTTNEQGLARCEHMALQPFQVRVEGMGLWPTKANVQPSLDGAPNPIQVRRLGGARIEATLVGSPLKRASIVIRSLEFDADVAQWIASGRIQSSSAALETDDEGRLRLDGLPNGKYRWSAKNSSDELVSGEFVVPPRAINDVRITLP